MTAALLLIALIAAQDTSAGKQVYSKWCAGCHGDNGAGDGLGAHHMIPPPRDFTGAIYQIRSTPSGQLPTDAVLRMDAALRAKISRLDAILFTHEHADHIMGLDDVRPFNFRQREAIQAFANPMTAAAIRRAFSYIWSDSQLGGACSPTRTVSLAGRSVPRRAGPLGPELMSGPLSS